MSATRTSRKHSIPRVSGMRVIRREPTPEDREAASDLLERVTGRRFVFPEEEPLKSENCIEPVVSRGQ